MIFITKHKWEYPVGLRRLALYLDKGNVSDLESRERESAIVINIHVIGRCLFHASPMVKA